MLTNEQRKTIEHSLKHSDDAILISIDGVGDYIAIGHKKNRKNATIKFTNASLVDSSCFYGKNYYGDVRPENFTIVLKDHLADTDCWVETRFYKDELISMKPFVYGD